MQVKVNGAICKELSLELASCQMTAAGARACVSCTYFHSYTCVLALKSHEQQLLTTSERRLVTRARASEDVYQWRTKAVLAVALHRA